MGDNVFEKNVKKSIDKKLNKNKKNKNDLKNNNITQQEISQDELLHFGNKKTEIVSENKQTVQENKQDIFVKQAQVYVSAETTQKNIRCLFCGFENKIGEEKCAICGQTLKRKRKIL